ncbi:cell division ATP-binding protein FtsE [Candidatus Foliamicus sp.]
MIRLQQVSMRYRGGAEALSEVSLRVEPGEFAYLTGPSGAGKTTLIKLLAAIERPSRGQVFVLGRNVGRLSRRAVCRHRRSIGIVFQNHLLLDDRSSYHNVALPLHISGLGPREVRRRTEAALDSVGLLKSAHKLPRLLSQGEQQRLGIARAVVNRPELLIADEPTGNLDPELSRDVMQLFRRMAGYGVTALVATHDLTLIDALPARRIGLAGGQIDFDTGTA